MMPVAREDVEHGTPKGYQWHQHHREPACAACKVAWAAYVQEWRRNKRSAESVAARNRYEAARLRALTRLGQLYPEEYAAFFAEELRR